MTTMTTAQRETQNAASFRKKLGILHRASVAVILCRSREPYRAIDAIRDFAWAERDLGFKFWTILEGWVTPSKDNPEAAPNVDNQSDILGAFRALGGTTDNGFGNGMYVSMYPHHFIAKIPPLIQMIKDYSKQLPSTKKRLILMCPPGYTLPPELQDDVVILDFELPSYAELKDTYTRTLNALTPIKRPKYSDAEMDQIIAAGAGMTEHEFETALSRSFITNSKELPKVAVELIVATVMEVKVEAVKRTEVLEVIPNEDMANVGGLQNLKDWLEQRKHCFSQEAADFGIDRLRGMMVVGPPGTGKSLIAKAVGSTLGLPVIKFDISRVFASLVGQSEERVDAALKMAAAMAPCVLFLDEIDKAMGGAHEGGGDSGVSKRVLGKLLTWLQENDAPVFSIFSANRVESLPSELIRKGRLDEIFAVSIPDDVERRQVLEIHLRKRKQDATKIDLDAAVAASEGYVPAEIEAAVKDAMIESFSTKTPISGEMVAGQLRLMTPLSQAFAEQFENMKRWAEQNARPANGSAERPRARPRERVRTTGQAASGPRALELDGQ